MAFRSMSRVVGLPYLWNFGCKPGLSYALQPALTRLLFVNGPIGTAVKMLSFLFSNEKPARSARESPAKVSLEYQMQHEYASKN